MKRFAIKDKIKTSEAQRDTTETEQTASSSDICHNISQHKLGHSLEYKHPQRQRT